MQSKTTARTAALLSLWPEHLGEFSLTWIRRGRGKAAQPADRAS